MFVFSLRSSLAWAQAQDMSKGISDEHSQFAFDRSSGRHDIPDTVFQDHFLSSDEISVYNSSLLMMIQNLLTRQEVLLEYFPSDTTLCVMAVTRESVEIFTSRITSEFWSEVKMFLKMIRLAETGDWNKRSKALSSLLLGRVSMKFKGKTKAIIIAHNGLHGFPFEVLASPVLASCSEVCKAQYFIEDREIVYNSSLTQWLNLRIRSKIGGKIKTPVNGPAFAGFSPGFKYNECIQDLDDAVTEISTIGQMFNEKGKVPLLMMNENSNEGNFKSIARTSHILHIATHTFSSDENPEMNGLLFYEFVSQGITSDKNDGLLAVREICELHIPADLIVLNSCSSANIRSRIGLNWFSCADCFIKAGARNVISTLWNINDRFAEQFMVDFYRYFLSGMTYSKALQQVKVKMINEKSTSLPFNWAAYVIMGE